MKAALAISIALLASGVGSALQSGRVADRVSRTQIKEDINPSDISQQHADMRSAIYGLAADEPNTAARFPLSGADPTIFVGGLGSRPSLVCVKIARAQGGYSAEFKARVPGGAGTAAIPFDSSPLARERLAADRPSALTMGIRATEAIDGKCGYNASAPLLPASWSSNPSDNYTILAGGGATGRAAIRVAGGDVQFCHLISEILQRSDLNAGIFAYSCPIRLAPSSCTSPVSVKLLWFRGSRLAGTASIAVKGPCRR